MFKLFAAVVLATSTVASTAPTTSAVIDPPRDMQFPAHNQQLLIPSHGFGMNAYCSLPAARDRTRPSS